MISTATQSVVTSTAVVFSWLTGLQLSDIFRKGNDCKLML